MTLQRQFSDDRFAGIETVDAAVDVAETVLAGLAADHAPDGVCGACSQQPLALEWAHDVHRANAVENVIDDVRAIAEDNGDSHHWVHGHLADHYIARFTDACGDPAGCWVCADAQVDADLECGHSRHGGDRCPVAD